MRCAAWVCQITGGDPTTHRDGVRLIVPSADTNGREYSSAEATSLKATLKTASPKVKLGRVSRCGGYIKPSIELVTAYPGTTVEEIELNIRWLCTNCGCSHHYNLPSNKEELENYLATNILAR